MNEPEFHAADAPAIRAPVQHVASPQDVQRLLDGTPAIFLSAGVPYKRPPAQGVSEEDVTRRVRQNDEFMAQRASEEQVRAAVVITAREILRSGVRLVFGAQPAISEMILSIGRDVVPESQRGEPRIVIFQSGFFEGQLPGSTLNLAAWDAGLLVFTPSVSPDVQPVELKRRDASLAMMRELMVRVPNLQAGIFIGGMEGVEEEARLFRKHNPDKPRFTLVSTGSAARLMFARDPSEFIALDHPHPTLRKPVSYSLIAQSILGMTIVKPGNAPPAAGVPVTTEKNMTMAYAPESPAVTAHISLLQGIINRLAGNSASCKTWCLTLVTGLVTLTGAAGKPGIVLVALVPLVVFGFLDANYLAQEREYRNLYKQLVGKLRKGEYTIDDSFEASARPPFWAWVKAFGSWSVWPLYIVLSVLALLSWRFEWLAVLTPAAAPTP